ncbi:MAG: hypothetical protein WBB74_07255 [Gaiellaceae bacterium]
MRWRNAWLTACSCLVLAAGCGGGSKPRQAQPRIPADVAHRLAGESDAVARSLDAGDRCAAALQAQQLQHDVIGSIASVPASLQETLMGTANDLAARVGPICPTENGPGKGHGKGHKKKHDGEGGD